MILTEFQWIQAVFHWQPCWQWHLYGTYLCFALAYVVAQNYIMNFVFLLEVAATN